MSIFHRDQELHDRLDWNILQNGWISLYLSKDILFKDVAWFQQEKFHVVEFDCTAWSSKEIIQKALQNGLDFPDYYGGNLSAFNDCLYHIDINNYGFVILFRNFQHVEKEYGFQLLDILASNARSHMLFGKKLITLVHVDDPHYEIDPVGASPVLWNPKEWLNTDRGI